jgi:hypothetical protein
MATEFKLLDLLSRMVRLACWSIACIVAIGCAVWAFGALHYDFPIWKTPVAWAFAAAVLAAVVFLCSAWQKLGAAFIAFALVLAWWLTLKPTNGADWQPDVAKVAWAEIDGDVVTLHNVRNCDYRTKDDFTPRWETRTVRLSQITGVDLAVDYWGSPWIAHPIASFQFADAPPVCFSIETRMKTGQTYSAIGGLYRQFELIYVVADERDVIRVRTNYRRGEDIYLYRTTLNPAQARERFLEYLRSLDEMRERPRWYNAITTNCTTSIRAQHSAAEHMPWDWRILLNGKGDEMMFENRTIATGGLPFAELRKKALINAAAKAADKSPGFSRLIREGLPGFALPPGGAETIRQ